MYIKIEMYGWRYKPHLTLVEEKDDVDDDDDGEEEENKIKII